MPNKNTFSIKPIKELIARHMEGAALTVDPFARDSKVATHTNDLNPETSAEHHMEAVDFLKIFPDKEMEGVLFDQPYSPRQVKEVYDGIGIKTTKETFQSSFYSKCKDEIARLLKPGGVVISFGWNSSGMGKNRGFEIIEILIVCHGAHHHDTICTVEVKK